jgi:hypothetical protein
MPLVGQAPGRPIPGTGSRAVYRPPIARGSHTLPKTSLFAACAPPYSDIPLPTCAGIS